MDIILVRGSDPFNVRKCPTLGSAIAHQWLTGARRCCTSGKGWEKFRNSSRRF